MPTIRFDRLRKVVKALRADEFGLDRFSFGHLYAIEQGSVEHPCKTVGCVMGDLPHIFPDDWFYDQSNVASHPLPSLRSHFSMNPGDASRLYFSLDLEEFYHLFIPESQNIKRYGGKFLYCNATRFEVADNFEAFILKMKER